jgi:hypothetical protein
VDLRDRLLGFNGHPGIEPLSDPQLRDRIAFHLVSVPSEKSGISGCPRGAPDRKTAFGLRAEFTDAGMTDLVVRAPGAVAAAFARVGSPASVEVGVVLANCPAYGGRGFYRQRLALVPILAEGEEELLADLLAHELSHAAIGLTDEYQSCMPESLLKGWPIPNIVTPKQLAAGKIPWSDLLSKSESDAKGRPKYRHECSAQSDPSGTKRRSLGLFWGSPFVDSAKMLEECDEDDGICGYYHGMWHCKMREMPSRFCRVCERAWSCAIRKAAGLKHPLC